MNHTFTSQRVLCIAILSSIIVFPAIMKAGIDKKFYKKAAEKVWSMDLPQFDPKADLSDSIYRNQSANYIARYIGLDADYNNDVNPSKVKVTGIQNSNTTIATLIRRNMVKLNDAAAIDYFSDFTIDIPMKEEVQGYMIASIKPAFGARVHKQDGTVVDVDMSDAVTVTTGKKNKDDEYKVAIPGLIVGDVLEYFYYTDYYFEELSMPDFTVNFLAKYPTRNFMLDCRVNPQLALEYGSYNGAPKITSFGYIGDQNQLFLELEDVESLDEDLPYFEGARQMPYMHIYVINHISRLEFHPKIQRGGGMRLALTPFVMRDVASAICSDKFPDKLFSEASDILKPWIKSHPDASEKEIADQGWLALRYALYKMEETVSQRSFVLAFYKLMEKNNEYTSARIGVTTSRKEVPITEIAHYSDADYFVKVDDRFYFVPNSPSLIPGEIPSGYDGEKYVVFSARPSNEELHTSAQYGNLPKGKSAMNTTVLTSTVTLDGEQPYALKVSSDVIFTGTEKSIANRMIPSSSYIKVLETYLGQKPSKKKKESDEEGASESRRVLVQNFARLIWGTEDAEMTAYEVKSTGSTPDKPVIELNINGKIEGAVTEAGNNLMINIGRLIGKQIQFKGSQRKRDISIVRSSPSKTDVTIMFEIPEGYELVEGSLDDLNRSVICREGAFNTEANLDGSMVKLRIVERYSNSISPASAWPDLLKILDTAHEFMSSSIVIRRK